MMAQTEGSPEYVAAYAGSSMPLSASNCAFTSPPEADRRIPATAERSGLHRIESSAVPLRADFRTMSRRVKTDQCRAPLRLQSQ